MALASYGQPAHLRAARGWCGPPATAASPSSRSTGTRWPSRAAEGDGARPPSTPTWRPASSSGWRRCCSSWPAGCTTRPATAALTMAGGVALNCVANSGLAERGPVRATSGCSRPPATPAPRSAPRCTWPTRSATGSRRCRPPPSGRAGPTTSSSRLAGRRPRCPTSARDDIAEAVAEVLAADGDRRLVPGPQRVRPAGARPPQPARPPRPRRQPRAAQRRQGPRAVPAGGPDGAAPSGPRNLRGGPIPSPYMLFTHRVRAGGPSASRRSSTSTAPPASRRSTAHDEPLVAPHARGLRAAHRAPRGGQHLAQHRRPADGRRPARRAGVLRLGAGRRPGPRAVPGPPRRPRVRPWRHDAAYDVVVPTDRAAQPAAALLDARSPRRRPSAGARRCWSTTGRDRSRPAARRRRAGALRRRGAARAGRGAGGGPQRRLARPTAASGSPSSTTTWCRGPDWRGGAGRRPRRAAAPDVGGEPGPARVPLPAGPAADRLGAQRRRPGDGPVGHRRHGLPADGAGRGRRLRRALPPGLPGGRRPRRCGSWRAGWRIVARASGTSSTRCGPAPWGQRAAPGGQRRRRADAAPARAGLAGAAPAAPAGRRRPRTSPPRRRRRSAPWRPLAGAGAGVGRRGGAALAGAPGPPSSPGAASPRAADRCARSPPWWSPRVADPAGGDRAHWLRGLGAAARLRRRRRRRRAPGADGRAVRPGRHAGRRRALQRRPGAGRAGARAPARRSTGCGPPGCRWRS